MNRRRPTTAGIDQLSLNLSVTRSPDGSVLASILFWPPGALRGGVTAIVFFCLAGCLEAAAGIRVHHIFEIEIVYLPVVRKNG